MIEAEKQLEGVLVGFKNPVPATSEALFSCYPLSTLLIHISLDLMNCQNLSLIFILELGWDSVICNHKGSF